MKTYREVLVLASAVLCPLGCFTPDSDDSGASAGTGVADDGSSDDGPADGGPGGDGAGTTGMSGDDTAASTGANDESSSGGGDTTPPTVIELSPAAGAMGVRDDEAIVIIFSEPMDRVATQVAWNSPDIDGTTMTWNADDTELTIVPDALAYATGPDEGSLQALEYGFTLDTTAVDVAGNPLEEPFTSNFFTLRRVVQELSFDDVMTGMMGPAVNGINDSNVYVGDTQFDGIQRGALTFDMPAFPLAFEEIEAAQVYVDQTIVGGDPYGPLPSLGEVHILDVEFATEFEAHDAPVLSDLGNFSVDATLETKTFDVTAAVVSDNELGNTTTQFRLQFPVATNGDQILDRVTFEKNTLGLELTYLAR